MKKCSLLLIAVLAFGAPLLRAANPVIATREGTCLEYAEYDKNDKLTGYSVQSVSKVSEKGGVTYVDFSVSILDKDKKQKKNVPSINMTYMITEGKVVIDMQSMIESMMPAEALAQMKAEGAGITIEGDNISYPDGWAVGEALPDISLTVSMTVNGNTMKINDITQFDRKVLAKETVTTDAGTFECYKLTETTTTKAIMGSQTETSVTWYAEGIGSVMSETYSKKGKLESKMKLVSLTRP